MAKSFKQAAGYKKGGELIKEEKIIVTLFFLLLSLSYYTA
jgi:hypothetical protein